MGLVVVAKSEGRALAARIFAAGLLALGLLAAAPQGWAQTVPDDNSVSSAKIVNGAVTGEKIADGAVGTAQLANAGVIFTGGQQVYSGVTGEKIADNQVSGAHLQANAALAGGGLEVGTTGSGTSQRRGLRIADGGVTTAKIADLAVTGAKIAADAINGGKIADDAVGSEHIDDGAVGTAALADLAVTGGKIAADAVTSAKIMDGTITADDLSQAVKDSISAAGGISAGSVSTNELADYTVDAVNGAATNGVTRQKIVNGAIGTAQIDNGQITAAKLAASLLSTAGGIEVSGEALSIRDGAISTARLATGAVTEGKIADTAVTAAKIAASAVTTAKIAASAVTTAKIADSAVTTDKIMDNTILYADVDQVSVGAGLQHDYHYQSTTAALSAAETDVAAITDETMRAHAENAVAAFRDGQRLTETEGYTMLQGGSDAAQQTARELVMRLNSDIWAAQEIGSRSDKIAGFAQASGTWSTAVEQDVYQNSSLRAQTNYLADRIGLDPHAAPLRYGSLQSQINYLFDTTSRQTAMVAALQDAYVPAGHRGGMTLGAATFGSETGVSFSLATIVGSRSKLSMSGALTKDYHERLFRVGYSLAW